MLVSSEEHLLSYQRKALALDLLVPGAHGRVGPGELEPVTGTPGEDAFQSGRKFWLTWTPGFVCFTFNFSYGEFLLDGSQVTARVFPVSSEFSFSKSFSFGRSLDFCTVPPGPLQEAGWKRWWSHLVPASCPSGSSSSALQVVSMCVLRALHVHLSFGKSFLALLSELAGLEPSCFWGLGP